MSKMWNTFACGGFLIFVAIDGFAECLLPCRKDPWSGWHPFWLEKERAFCSNRVFSAEARTTIYDEAVNAFRTHADDKGWWQGEYWGKFMLSAVAVQRMTRDEQLKKWIAEKALAFVREFQRPDGYLSTYSDPWDIGPNPDGGEKFNWNLWGRKYTMWALVEISDILREDVRRASPRARADKILLAAAVRMMDHEIAQFGERNVQIDRTGYFAGLPSMSVLKPLMLLYRRTGKSEYLAFAEKIIDKWRADGDARVKLIADVSEGRPVHRWHEKPEEWAKSYEMMSCLEGVLDYADCKHDKQLVATVSCLTDKLATEEGNPFGSVGYFDHFVGARLNPNAITEICDVIHWIRLNRALFLLTGKAVCVDRCEDAFLNGFLPGVFRDGTWGAHATRSHGSRQYMAPHQIGMKHHHCCVDNACRTWRDFYETAAALSPDGSVAYLNLYWPGTYRVKIGKERVEFVIGEGYPFAGKVSVKVKTGRARTVKFRAPAWAEGFAVNGVASEEGWVTISVPGGKNASRFTVTYGLKPQLHDWKGSVCTSAQAKMFESEKTTPEMKGTARKTGAVYLTYGPVLLAKSSVVGTTRKEALEAPTVAGRGFSCTLDKMNAAAAWGAWRATFSNGKERFAVNVCDLQSHDGDDPKGVFSIWF